MAVRKWHYGKLVLLWAWGIVVCVALVFAIPHVSSFVIGFPLIALIPTILIALSVITWKWLGGKEAEAETRHGAESKGNPGIENSGRPATAPDSLPHAVDEAKPCPADRTLDDAAITPDGRRVAYVVSESQSDVWMIENFDPEAQ
jgi:hypothetical protein